jgi:hypothetical protein
MKRLDKQCGDESEPQREARFALKGNLSSENMEFG